MPSSLWAPLDYLYERRAVEPPSKANAISLDDLVDQAEAGDVLLFRCNQLQHPVVRAVCYTAYDHVAVVAVDRQGNKLMLESCVLGCCAFDLEARLRQYQRYIADDFAWRKLVAERPQAMAETCASFVEEVNGKPYDYNPLKIFFTSRHGDEANAASKERAYYCSEIVAALYQRCGLLSKACKAASFWPGDLADGGVCERWLESSVSLAPAVLLKEEP